jgi:hypothetical protein
MKRPQATALTALTENAGDAILQLMLPVAGSIGGDERQVGAAAVMVLVLAPVMLFPSGNIDEGDGVKGAAAMIEGGVLWSWCCPLREA